MTTPASSLRELLSQAGFSGQGLETAVAVSMAESGGRPLAHNGNAGTGDNSYGLFQINMLGSLGPARLAQYGLSSNDDLYDPLTNAKIAYAMSDHGTNWQPWTTYTRGTYKNYLGQDPPLGGTGALGAAGGDDGHGGDDTGQAAMSGYGIGTGAPLTGMAPSSAQQSTDIAYLLGQPDPTSPTSSGLGGGLAAGLAPGQTPDPSVAQHFVAAAVAQRYDQYQVGARGSGQADPTKFDCSGLVQWSAHQVGVDLPDTSYQQYLQLKAEGALIPVDQAIHTPGALLFTFSEEPTPGGGPPDERHVAISLGNGRTIEAANPDDGVNEFNATGRFQYAAIVPGIGAAATGDSASTLVGGSTFAQHDPWDGLSTDHTSPIAELLGQGGVGGHPGVDPFDDGGVGGHGLDLGH